MSEDNKILEPGIGTIVRHLGWWDLDPIIYPCDVYIENGHYKVDGRISNFWKWRRVHQNGLGIDEHGYGNFETAKHEYKIEIKVTRI